MIKAGLLRLMAIDTTRHVADLWQHGGVALHYTGTDSVSRTLSTVLCSSNGN